MHACCNRPPLLTVMHNVMVSDGVDPGQVGDVLLVLSLVNILPVRLQRVNFTPDLAPDLRNITYRYNAASGEADCWQQLKEALFAALRGVYRGKAVYKAQKPISYIAHRRPPTLKRVMLSTPHS